MSSVRDFIKGIQREMREDDLLPDRASELLNQATSLLGNVLDEARDSEMDYKRVLLGKLGEHAKANRARIEAETSDEYARWREARDIQRLTEEMIRSLKVYLRSKAEEMRLGG